MIKNLFITGTVGVGKTTLIKETVLPFASSVGGFYTEELLQDGRRQGFRLKTFNGKEGILALKGRKNPQRFGKYGIDMDVLESIGVQSLQDALAEKKIIIIDEIGSMEILSEKFHTILMECLLSDKYVLAAIRHKAQPFSKDLTRLKNLRELYLTKENFRQIRSQVEGWIQQCLKQ